MDAPQISPQPNERTLVKETGLAIWDNGPLLAILSLLLGVIALPSLSLILGGFALLALIPTVLLVMPAWAALYIVQADMLQGRVARFGDFWRALPRLWLRAALFGLLMCIPIILGLFTLPMLSLETVPWFVWASLFVDGFVLLGLVAISLYYFPLLVLHNLAFRTAFVDAAILTTRLPFHTMGMIGMAVLFGFAIRWQPALGFFLPTIWAMFAVNNCRFVLAKEKDL